MDNAPVKVFISYAREDAEFLDRLRKHLRPLERKGLVVIWDDSQIMAGERWTDKIKETLNESDIFLFLVSADLLASEFIYSKEIKIAIEKHQRGEAIIMPIIVKNCYWQDSPLAEFQALPTDGRSLTSIRDFDEGVFQVVKGVQIASERVIEQRRKLEEQILEWKQSEINNIEVEDFIKRHKYKIQEVFVTAGPPNITFVPPDEFQDIKLNLLQPGKGIVIEGPSGIGKTSVAIKVLENVGYPYKLLSARLDEHILLIERIREWHKGIVVIDDFHRLDEKLQEKIADYLKFLADYGVNDKKLVIIGIPNTGNTLIRLSFDLANRIAIFKLGSAREESILKLIEFGEKALNIEFFEKSSIIRIASGSLYITQLLCAYTAYRNGIEETQQSKKIIEKGVFEASERALKDLSPKFDDLVLYFSAIGGKKDRTCIELLKELTLTEEGVLNLHHLKARRQELKTGIINLLQSNDLESFFNDNPACKRHLLFDIRIPALIIDDPQLKFYLNNVPIEKIIALTGKTANGIRNKVFISYSHTDEEYVKKVLLHLKHLERKGIIDLWVDKRIKAGQNWREEIEKALSVTKVAILLVSQNFLASDFILESEVPPILKAVENEGAKILQVFLRPCSINSFEELKQFQMINDIKKPLAALNEFEQDEILVRLAEYVEEYMADE